MSVSLSNALDPKSVKHGTTKSSKNSNDVNGRVHNSEVMCVFVGYMSFGYFCSKEILYLFFLLKI